MYNWREYLSKKRFVNSNSCLKGRKSNWEPEADKCYLSYKESKDFNLEAYLRLIVNGSLILMR